MTDQPMTVADQEATEHPIAETIPTDDAGLYAFIQSTPNYKRWLIAAYIKQQTGKDLTDRVDRMIGEIEHYERIEQARQELRTLLAAAVTAVTAVTT